VRDVRTFLVSGPQFYTGYHQTPSIMGLESVLSFASATNRNMTGGVLSMEQKRRSQYQARQPRTCLLCGNAMMVFASRLKDGKGRFCSRECNLAYRHTSTYIAERFWSKVKIGGPDECWEWQASTINTGYGQFRISVGIMESSHQFAYQLAYGKIPDGLFTCHHCDNPPCCNPSHLFLGTCQDNKDDSVRKGRQLRGEGIGVSKLTAREVLEIRSLYPSLTGPKLAERYHVSDSLIYVIINRQCWKHI
jgi:hypothetical protein